MEYEEWKKLHDHTDSSQDPKELHWLYNAVEAIKPHIVMEIGVWAGGTLKVFSNLLKEKSDCLIGLDIVKRPMKWHLAELPYETHYIEGCSYDLETVEATIEALNGREIDFLFIDGSHDYKHIVLDTKLYGNLVKKGGIIGYHDLNMWSEVDGGPKQFFDELPQPKYSFFSDLHDDSGYGIGYIIKGEYEKTTVEGN